MTDGLMDGSLKRCRAVRGDTEKSHSVGFIAV